MISSVSVRLVELTLLAKVHNMSDSLKRRAFLKTLSLAGASVVITNPVSANALPGTESNEIKNADFNVSFDKTKGTINIYRNNEVSLLIGGTVCVNSSGNKQFVSPANFTYSLDSKSFTDQLGSGKTLVIHCKDKNKRSDIAIQISLYEQQKVIVIGVAYKNVSAHDITINSIEPLRVIKNEGGSLNVPGVSKCITNGEMYYDTGTIHGRLVRSRK